MKPSSSLGQRGKWAEGQVQGWLEKRSDSDIEFAWNRYPDARSARGALSAQPSDFLVARLGHGTYHLEAKETAQVNRLPKAKISQYGRLKLFHLAGITPIVIVYITMTQEWTWLGTKDLYSHDVCPPSFKLSNARSSDMNGVLASFFGPIRNASL